MKTKLLSLVLSLITSIGTMFAESGTCGAHLTWNLTNGVLTISGTGDMTNFENNLAPWFRMSITEVSIGHSVTSIGSRAFYDCRNLTSVSIGNSVTSIGNEAFEHCIVLTSVAIPNSVTSIEDSAFYYCTSLTSINIPNSVTSIGSGAFNYCTSLTSINIPNSVTSIGSGAFLYCRSLTSVTIPNSVTSIGNTAFANCSGLTSVTIPSSVTSIGTYTFSACSGLTNIEIPNSVTSIGNSAFQYCRGLTSVTIPNSVTSIGSGAFQYCSGLTSVTIPNSVTSIGSGAFRNCIVLTSVTIPNSVTSIGSGAFLQCYGLTSIEIPNSVTSIESCTFRSCRELRSIAIPNSVTSIGDSAFYGCTNLLYVTCSVQTPPSINRYCFSNCDTLSSIYVPCGTLDAYKQSWSIYRDLIQYQPLEYSITVNANNIEMGNVIIPINICEDTVLTATPNYGYHFVQWSDGNTDNPRTIWLSQDTTMEVVFAKNTYAISTAIDDSIHGRVFGDTSVLYLDKIQIYATPYYGYHFDHWNDGSISNPRTITVTKDETYTATFAKNIYTITKLCDISKGLISGAPQAEYLDSVELPAIPNRGFYFVQWADGNTDNPRIIELTKDTTIEAIFDYLLEGKCGKDSVLTWTFEPADMALTIAGKGALTENYTYGTFLESLAIGNEITSIGQNAFSRCGNLKNVIIGSSVKVLEQNAFYNCSSIESITCYSMRPPTVNQNALYGLDYSTIVYVPADYLNTYLMHDTWGLYDVRPLGATSTETSDLRVVPGDNTAEVVWPAVTGAYTYELVIRDKDGNVVCTLIFNANGQLTSIAFAPSADAPQQTHSAGFSFTVTGLDANTGYDLTMTSKDNSGSTLQSNTVSFWTGSPQAIDEINTGNAQTVKTLRNGQILILRGDKAYTLTGQEIH